MGITLWMWLRRGIGIVAFIGTIRRVVTITIFLFTFASTFAFGVVVFVTIAVGAIVVVVIVAIGMTSGIIVVGATPVLSFVIYWKRAGSACDSKTCCR